MNGLLLALICAVIISLFCIVRMILLKNKISPLEKELSLLMSENQKLVEGYSEIRRQIDNATEYILKLNKLSKGVSNQVSSLVAAFNKDHPYRKVNRQYSNSFKTSPDFLFNTPNRLISLSDSKEHFKALESYLISYSRYSSYNHREKKLSDQLQSFYMAMRSFCDQALNLSDDFVLYNDLISKEKERQEKERNESTGDYKVIYIQAAKELKEYKERCDSLSSKLSVYQDFYDHAKSNLSLFPYMAGIVSEFETRDIEELAQKLDWGHNFERFKKVESIREIRRKAQEKIEQAKEAEYQLSYLLQMFPSLQELLEYEYSSLPQISDGDLAEHDAVKDYLSKEEWASLSITDRNQLALDRYIASRKKTNWQVGRDYEEYVGYRYRCRGFSVDNYGAYMGIADLGRDIIAKKENRIYIIQCKYWSHKKEIHENHVNQLFGTVTSYCIENDLPSNDVTGVIVTNTVLSEKAKEFSVRLGIKYVENYEIGDYPRIKCNIGRGDGSSRIYHLPFDQQYDSTKICNPGEFYALTVAEAEAAGFRRAFKWRGNS